MGNRWTTFAGFGIGHKVMVLGWSLRIGDQSFRVWREERGGALMVWMSGCPKGFWDDVTSGITMYSRGRVVPRVPLMIFGCAN